jgi:glucose/mannose-6-phosphate isomerase
MYKTYDKWPEIAENAFNSNLEQVNFKDIDHIVFSGMGGSGALGDFFSSILSKSEIHVSIVKGYLLPKTVNKNSLVVITSISGNTSETFQVLKAAKKISCKIIAFSSGGQIEKYCLQNKILFRKISEIHSPRASFVNFLYSMLKVLSPCIPVKKIDVEKSIKGLYKTRGEIESKNLTRKNPALNLALWVKEIPIIYYPWGLQAAAIRFKSSLQENTKIHVISEDVLEASHNGIVSWEKPSLIQPILIQGVDDNVKTKERWRIFEQYFKNNEIDYTKIVSNKGDIISKLINLIYILDYASIYLAVKNKTDPTPVKSIDYIKKRL